mgnify:CR=1 FL=1
MKNSEIKKFFKNIKNLNLSNIEKNKMMEMMQVRGINKKNKKMSYSNLKSILNKKNGKITNLVLGPEWSKLIFVDINIEI